MNEADFEELMAIIERCILNPYLVNELSQEIRRLVK